MFIHPYSYTEIFTIVPVGRQKHPLFDFEEDNCEVIIDKKFNSYYLMVPESGSSYICISEEEAKKYMGK
jgi:hypothetical protein